jgi:hypothetical protein
MTMPERPSHGRATIGAFPDRGTLHAREDGGIFRAMGKITRGGEAQMR